LIKNLIICGKGSLRAFAKMCRGSFANIAVDELRKYEQGKHTRIIDCIPSTTSIGTGSKDLLNYMRK